MDNPCIACKERSEKCHSICEKYKGFREKLESTKQRNKAAKVLEYYECDVKGRKRKCRINQQKRKNSRRR